MTTGSIVEQVSLEDRLVESTAGALELLSVYVGRQLGLYRALGRPRTLNQLAAQAGIDPRYAREWLEQQATAGFLTVDNESARAEDRVFSLPDHHADVLVDPESPYQVGPLSEMVVGIAQVIDDVVAAYRSGEGVPYARYGKTFRDGQGAINRPAFTHDLVDSWLPTAVPDVTSRLQHGGSVADLGCGAGWSSIAVARGFPNARVVGLDSDEASVIDARNNAEASRADVHFIADDAASLSNHGPFDLIVILEALHDMANPSVVLRQARSALTKDGALVIADEAVADSFHANGDVIERMMFGWSVLHCLPAAKAEPDSAAIGTMIREGLVRQLALSGGFGTVETPDVDGGFFRIYVLRP